MDQRLRGVDQPSTRSAAPRPTRPVLDNTRAIRAAIVGSGHIAATHGPLIHRLDHVEIVGIADPDQSNARALATELGVEGVYPDLAALLSEQTPDVVHVLAPPQYHASLSMLALQHGCHVLVEKPMALSVPDATAMIEAARQNGVL